MIHDSLPLDKAELIGIFLESLLYGISSLLFVVTIWVLVYQRKSERLNKRLVFTSSLMMVLGTLHIAIDLARLLEGFINQRDLPGGPIAYFGRLFEWAFIFKTSIFVLQVVLADSFATYRCYVVWNRWWSIAIPSLLVTGTLISGIAVLYMCSILKPGTTVFAQALTGWITAFFTLTLATNVCTTTLIASRIWFTTKKVSHFSGQQTLLPVVIIVVESGAVYSLSCVIVLILYLIGSNAQYPAIDGTFPMISIVFNLIIVRIALGIAHGGTTGGNTTHNPPSGIVDPSARSMHGAGGPGAAATYPMKPLAVTVTQLVQQDTDMHVQSPGGAKEREADEMSLTDGSQFTVGKERAAWNAV